MYCPRCGTENPDGSAYCRNCGTSLASAVASATPQPPVTLQGPQQGLEHENNPLMAGILNLLFGLGYVYLGYDRVMRVQVAVFVPLMIALYFFMGIVTDGVASLAMAILLAVDGYQKGSGLNGYISAERKAGTPTRM